MERFGVSVRLLVGVVSHSFRLAIILEWLLVLGGAYFLGAHPKAQKTYNSSPRPDPASRPPPHPTRLRHCMSSVRRPRPVGIVHMPRSGTRNAGDGIHAQVIGRVKTCGNNGRNAEA